MAKSVREVALALDQVAGADPEDAVTQEASRHTSGSFAADLSPAALKGARIGLLRQRFVGFTGEREIATLMDTVAGELRAAGATIVEVNVPDIESKFRAVRSSEPGALKAAWIAYLSRGAKPGEKVLTLEDLLASGKLAPDSASRFKAALAPTPSGDELREAVRAFTASRDDVPRLLRRVDGCSSGSTRCCIRRTSRARTPTKAGSSVSAASRARARRARRPGCRR